MSMSETSSLPDINFGGKVSRVAASLSFYFILTPGRYVGIEEQEEDGEPFKEKMQRLTSELSGMFAESIRLQDEIRKKLGAIGYEI